MKKHLGTILGLILAVAVAFGIYIWDGNRRTASVQHRALMLSQQCYEDHRAASGAAVSEILPECDRFYREARVAESAALNTAAIWAACAGGIFALLFFGGRRLMRKRQPAA